MHEHAGGNIANEDVSSFGVIDIAVSNSNHLSVCRRRDGEGPRSFRCRPPPPDGAGYAACLEVPANDE